MSAAVVVQAPVAEALSPSQVGTFVDCQARWYYKHVIRLPDPTTAKLLVGKALHRALAANFRQKIESREDLPVEQVLDAYAVGWVEDLDSTEFQDKEDPVELCQTGARLAAQYMAEAAPGIQPWAVEEPVSGEIGGVRVRGIVDLMDRDGRIIDVKSSSRKPNGLRASHRLQLASYAAITPGASGQVRLDTLVKTKTPQLVQQTHQVGEQDKLYAETMYPLARDAMRSGLFVPNRGSWLCSRANCSFWRQCEKEYGGEVAP